MRESPQRERLRQDYEKRLRLLVPAAAHDLARVPLLAMLPEKARDKVVEKVRPYTHFLDFAPGEVVLRAGEYSDSVYYVLEGAAEAVLELPRHGEGRRPVVRGGAHVQDQPRVPAPRGPERSDPLVLGDFPVPLSPGRPASLAPGDLFGDMSALSRFAVAATVRAKGPLKVLRIRLPGLRMLSAVSPAFRHSLDERYREHVLSFHLRRAGLLSDVDQKSLDRLKEHAELLTFRPGELVVEESTPADGFYLVRGGYLKASVRVGESDLAITYLRPGDFAGESAVVLEDQRWPFSLRAVEHVEIVHIDREAFALVVGKIPRLHERLWTETVARLKARGAASRSPIASEYLQMAADTGLIHGESVLLIDLTTCTRCDDCVTACAETHGGQPVFVREGQRYRHWLVPTSCYQCTDPVCLMDCPTGAITRSMGTLEVTVDDATCIGCSNCAKRCPWGNIVMVETDETRPDGHPVELASKCDLCVGRKAGPACVNACPHGSAVRISFKDMDRVRSTLT